MPLDQLDQQMVDSLPQLADVYDRYGVQVNALSVSEIFALYERTGFLYPDKAARLFPHLAQVRENWRRMLKVGDSLLYVLTAGDHKKRAGIFSCLARFAERLDVPAPGFRQQPLRISRGIACGGGGQNSQRLRRIGAELVPS